MPSDWFAMGQASNIKERLKKNCMQDLEEPHSGAPRLPLQVHAVSDAGCGRRPRWTQ